MSEVLKSKSYRSYNYISRYASFPVYYHTIDGKNVYGTTSQLVKTTDYTIHKVVRGESYDSLSLYYYNSPLYYWIIADFNGVQDTLEPLVEGTLIKIPSLSNIMYEED